MVAEMLRRECELSQVKLCEAEVTLLALGIHADTGERLRARSLVGRVGVSLRPKDRSDGEVGSGGMGPQPAPSGAWLSGRLRPGRLPWYSLVGVCGDRASSLPSSGR